MTQEHPITPPPELVEQWYEEAGNQPARHYVYMAHQAARWGADQELEACCEWLIENGYKVTPMSLRVVRRSKPPSLKEQALGLIDSISSHLDDDAISIIRRALADQEVG